MNMSYDYNKELNLVSFEESFEQAKDGVKALICLTGGLDSSYYLWKYAQYTSHDTIDCHHVNFLPYNRGKTELATIHRICKYIKDNYNKDINLIKTELKIDLQHENVKFDSDWVVATYLSRGYAGRLKCKYIVTGDDLPSSYDRAKSYSVLPEKDSIRIKNVNEMIKTNVMKSSVVTWSSRHDLSEMYNEMPEDYIQLIFSCYNPEMYKYDHPYYAKRCFKCGACTRLRNFGWYDRTCHKIPKEVKEIL